MVEHSLHPPPPPPSGVESEKLKKVWKYRAGADLLKRRGAGTFPIYFFQVLSFLHLEITLSFAKLCCPFEEKNFSATITL